MTLSASQSVTGYTGDYTYSGNGVSGNIFNPSPAASGEYTISVMYQATVNGTGADGTIDNPAVPINATDAACGTSIDATIKLQAPHCGDLPWDGQD